MYAELFMITYFAQVARGEKLTRQILVSAIAIAEAITLYNFIQQKKTESNALDFGSSYSIWLSYPFLLYCSVIHAELQAKATATVEMYKLTDSKADRDKNI